MLSSRSALAASMSQYLSDRILGAANVQVQYDVEITGLDGVFTLVPSLDDALDFIASEPPFWIRA